MISLNKLCEHIVPVPEEVVGDFPITGIVSDSRQVERGNLFVAVPGFETDGHDFIEEAIGRGAGVVVVEKEVGIKLVPAIRVEDSRKAMALLAHRFYGEPSKELLLLGITGTNGKTTVSYLLESILDCSGLESGLLGTMTYRWKGHEELAERTTPESVDIHCLLRKMKDDGVRAVVMEVSSHALALHRVWGMMFRVAVFTNLSREHLDFHSSLHEYGETKAKLFEMLSSGGVGVINGDDSASRLMQRSAKGRTVTFGEKNRHLDYRIDGIETQEGETMFFLVGKDRRISLATCLWGKFNVMNVAAAAVVGLELGLDENTIQEGVRRIRRVRGRMEGLRSSRGFRIVIDYAHTPDALENILIAAREFTKNRLIVVFGCGGDRDRGKRPEMGEIGANLADVVFVTSDNPRSEDPEAILKDILEGIKLNRGVETIVDRKEAIHKALDEAREGDTVVIAGKGHETYQEIGTRRIPFDDRAVTEAYLKTSDGV